jgi:chromate reductase
MYKVSVLVGSLATNSINRLLARAMSKLAAPNLELTEVGIADLPMLNSEVQNDPPNPVWRMKKEIEASDAFLLVSPENNRSVPAVLKNAIDWGSRPWGQNTWANRPGAVIGISPGSTGTAAMQQHLRLILSPLEARIMGQPEAYLQFKAGLIDEQYNVTDAGMKQVLQKFLNSFGSWIEREKSP